jgi:hypothetical protein
MKQIVRDALNDPLLARLEVNVGPLERFLTFEGEHAGLVHIAGHGADGLQVERTLSLIAGDDWGQVLDVATSQPARFAELRQLARHVTELSALRLGEQRQRRFEHRPPAGWTAIGRATSVLFLHPAYPRVPTLIEVSHARRHRWDPTEGDPLGTTGDLPDPRARGAALRTLPVQIDAVLGGSVREWEPAIPGGTRGLFAVAELADTRYEYRLALQCDELDPTLSRRAFLDVMYSIHPVPIPRGGRDPADALGAWSD